VRKRSRPKPAREGGAIVRTNEGFLDRTVRVLVGAGFLSLLAIEPVTGWGLVGLIGLLPVVTGLTGYCPLYVPLGIDTRGRQAAEPERS
jgi:hypothetical protein